MKENRRPVGKFLGSWKKTLIEKRKHNVSLTVSNEINTKKLGYFMVEKKTYIF